MIGDMNASGMVLEQFNKSTLDRFGRPTFGLRAQREPEKRENIPPVVTGRAKVASTYLGKHRFTGFTGLLGVN